MTSADTLTWTALTPADAPALTALLNRVDAADDLGEPAEEPSIRDWLSMPGIDLPQDSLAVRLGEETIAFSLVDVGTSTDREGRVRCSVAGAVDPAHRRSGIGTELFERAERRAAQLATERYPGKVAVFRASGGRDPEERDPEKSSSSDAPPTGGADVRPILDRRGYRRVRSWLTMVRELPGAALPAPVVHGVRVVRPSDDHREPARLAHNAAFADHWGSASVDEDRWSIWWSSHTARRDMSTVAVDPEGTVLGYAITSEDKPGVLHIALVGTRPDARGRGIARAVIARTLEAAAQAGYAGAELEVDAESLTGATRLYDALGFTRDQVFGTYEKPVA